MLITQLDLAYALIFRLGDYRLANSSKQPAKNVSTATIRSVWSKTEGSNLGKIL